MQPTDNAALWIALGPEVMECPSHLDCASAPQLEEDAMLCIESGAQEMILDASKTTYLTAAGLRTILSLAKALKKTGGKLAVCNLGPQAQEIFERCGFDHIVDNYGPREVEDFSKRVA